MHPAVAQLHERGSCASPAWTTDTAQLISVTLTLLADFVPQLNGKVKSYANSLEGKDVQLMR